MKGHVRLRGDVWYAVMSVTENGKRRAVWKSLRDCKGKREAQQECARIVTEMQSGYVAPDKTTVAQFLERWLAHIQTQVASRTYAGYSDKIRNLIPALGGIRLSKLRPEQISEAYSRALISGRRDGRGGLSAQTVRHMHGILKQALAQACLWQAITHNPANVVRPPKLDRGEMQTVNTDQTAAMIEAARGTPIFIPILLGVLCGMRRGEICALRWRSIDLDAGQLSVVASTEQGRGGMREKEPKNGRGRLIALPPIVVTELRRHRMQQAEWLLRLGIRLTDDHHVCLREDGESVWPSSLTRAFRTLMRRHRLPAIRFHDLRHSHATHLLAANVHPKIAQERLGHSNVSITLNTYSHVVPGMQRDAAAKVDAVIQAALNKWETK
jgi:integrase